MFPSHELSGPRIVQIKLDNGYNVGVRVGMGDRLTILPEEESLLPTNSNGGAPLADPAMTMGVGV